MYVCPTRCKLLFEFSSRSRSGKQIHLLGYRGQSLERLIDLLGGMFARHMVRTRALPSGTVGKAIPVAIKPASNRAREKSIVFFPSPMMIGVIGVSLAG